MSFDSNVFYMDDDAVPQDSTDDQHSITSISSTSSLNPHLECQEGLKKLRQKMDQKDYEICMHIFKISFLLSFSYSTLFFYFAVTFYDSFKYSTIERIPWCIGTIFRTIRQRTNRGGAFIFARIFSAVNQNNFS